MRQQGVLGSLNLMESMGDRIRRLRESKDWSYRRLGREMGAAIGAGEFSGEAVRRYEIGKNRPGKDARRALAKVFGKTEQYIEWGASGDSQENADPLLQQLLRLFGELSPDGRHAVLGYANLQHNKEHPEASAANPFPNATPPKTPLIHGSLVGKARQSVSYSRRTGKK